MNEEIYAWWFDILVKLHETNATATVFSVSWQVSIATYSCIHVLTIGTAFTSDTLGTHFGYIGNNTLVRCSHCGAFTSNINMAGCHDMSLVQSTHWRITKTFSQRPIYWEIQWHNPPSIYGDMFQLSNWFMVKLDYVMLTCQLSKHNLVRETMAMKNTISKYLLLHFETVWPLMWGQVGTRLLQKWHNPWVKCHMLCEYGTCHMMYSWPKLCWIMNLSNTTMYLLRLQC